MNRADAALTERKTSTDLADMAWGEARLIVHSAPRPVAASQCAPSGAAGLTLAEDLVARTPMPSFDTAAMDGYAVAGSGPYRVCGEVVASVSGIRTLRAGHATVISAGALVPAGAAAVIPREQGHSDRRRDGDGAGPGAGQAPPAPR